MIEVVHGDCMEVLPTVKRADVVITDPVWPGCPAGLIPGAGDAEGLLAGMLERLPASVKRLVIVLRTDVDPRFLSLVSTERWPFFGCCWLPYVLPSRVGRKLLGNEIAYCFGAPVPAYPGKTLIPAWACMAQPNRLRRFHPACRSVAHMSWLVKWWSAPSEVVLDPFAGIGTTGIAASRMGRSALLIEIDWKYADRAAKLIKGDQPLFSKTVFQMTGGVFASGKHSGKHYGLARQIDSSREAGKVTSPV